MWTSTPRRQLKIKTDLVGYSGREAFDNAAQIIRKEITPVTVWAYPDR